MSYAITVLPSADADVDEIGEYIAEDSVVAAERFFDAVLATYLEIQQHPLRRPLYRLRFPRADDLRMCAILGFDNYLCFYRLIGDRVEVRRVLHGARDIPAILGNR